MTSEKNFFRKKTTGPLKFALFFYVYFLRSLITEKSQTSLSKNVQSKIFWAPKYGITASKAFSGQF